MVNAADKPGDRKKSRDAGNGAPARADLVNSGQDTRITLRDGSTIVLKGVTQIDAVFSLDCVQRGS